ncbi:hypothetical protein FHR70_000153 [Microvirga lupini]|uniref:Uncharacterized protein n=1 Tax=Microvirga lupini TaxID=420324 RepID=A0A7W4VH60_9HYPH|nr:hypothetical protein [Microvirga lupini]MBB3017113.1 hypothetical protein [Microvirga lupini]
MLLLLRRSGCLLLPLVLGSTVSWAEEVAQEAEIWSADLTPEWLDEHVAVLRRSKHPRPSYNLKRTQVWTNGLARSPTQSFQRNASDHAVGAKLQPLHDYNFLVGTELIRGGGHYGSLQSKATWEAFVTRDWESLGGVTFGLSTAGLMDMTGYGYAQSVSGTMGISLDLPLQAWSTQLRFAPSVNVDAANGDFSAGLLSEVTGRTLLSAPADRYRSVLNLTLGYGLAPRTQPVASARLELRITPNL